MSREYGMLVEESSYGQPVASPVKGTNLFYPRLHDGDAWTGQSNPVTLDIMYGGGLATPAVRVYDQYVVAFAFRTYLYPGAYSAFLLNWCMTPIDSGRTVPWTTTDANFVMPPGDLASISFYHGIMRNNGTWDLRMYNGCKVHSWTITCSRQEPRALLTINGFGIRDDHKFAGAGYPDNTEFPLPAETDYPTAPYLFSGTTGNVVVIDSGSSPRSLYDNVSLSVTNAMDRQYFESQYMLLDKFCGQTSTLSLSTYIKPTPDDLAFLQAQTKLKASVKFSNGVNTLKVDMLTQNYHNTVQRALPLNAIYRRTLTLENQFDPSNAGDLVLTTT